MLATNVDRDKFSFAVVSLLSAGQVAGAVIVFLIAVAIVGVVMAAKARNAEREMEHWQHRRQLDVVPVASNVSSPAVPPQIAEAQVARQSVPSPVPAPQSVPQAQAEWTEECSAAVDALVALRISKRRAIDLVRRAVGTTQAEILRNALKIHGQSRTQPITSDINGHAMGANASAPANQVPATGQKQQVVADAMAALVSLGIPSKQAVALVQEIPGSTSEELIRGALQTLRSKRR